MSKHIYGIFLSILIGLTATSAQADVCPKNLTGDQLKALRQEGQFTGNDTNGVSRVYRGLDTTDLPDNWYNIYTKHKAKATNSLMSEKEEDRVVTCTYAFKGLIFSSLKKITITTTLD